MLAVRRAEPFTDPAWGFEVKWDGVRAILSYDGERVRLTSRAGNDATARYPELTGFAQPHPTILDGEIVALDEANRPSFERLQQRMNLSSPAHILNAVDAVPISYIVFDVLYENGPLIERPWTERRARVPELALEPPFVRSEPVDHDPSELWRFVTERGIEGIMAKRLASPYRPGQRSPDWQKITAFRSMRAVVGGFTEGEGGCTGTFGALLLGLWDGDVLRWVGAVGSGFSDADLRAIRAALDEMTTDQPTFVNQHELPASSRSVHPALVAVVQYKEWTTAGKLRGPSFKGFTDDPADSITWDAEGPEATLH